MAIDDEGDCEMENANVPAFHLIDIDMPVKVNTAMDQGDVSEARLSSQTQVRPEEQELSRNGGNSNRLEAI